MTLAIYPLNPDYGAGQFRRRIRIVGMGDSVTAVLNDDYHSMWCRIIHDGQVVRAVDARTYRIPKTTCPGSADQIREVVGLTLDMSRSEFYGAGRAGRNCTHLLDLALLALSRADRGRFEQMFDMVVPDALGDMRCIEVSIDGARVHQWTVRDTTIVAPIEFRDQSLFGGFVAWATSMFAGDVLDAALMAQKAVFVARGRRHIVDQDPGVATVDEPERLGQCFSFSEPQFSIAHDLTGYFRDFSDGLVEMLPDHLCAQPDTREGLVS